MTINLWRLKPSYKWSEANWAADCLANLRNHLPLGLHVFDNAPSMIQDIMLKDIIGVSFYCLCN